MLSFYEFQHGVYNCAAWFAEGKTYQFIAAIPPIHHFPVPAPATQISPKRRPHPNAIAPNKKRPGTGRLGRGRPLPNQTLFENPSKLAQSAANMNPFIFSTLILAKRLLVSTHAINAANNSHFLHEILRPQAASTSLGLAS